VTEQDHYLIGGIELRFIRKAAEVQRGFEFECHA